MYDAVPSTIGMTIRAILTVKLKMPPIVKACGQAHVELTFVVEVKRADQAFALVQGGLGLTIVDEFAAGTASGCVVRPLVEDLEMIATFVYSKFSPPPGGAVLLMHTRQQLTYDATG